MRTVKDPKGRWVLDYKDSQGKRTRQILPDVKTKAEAERFAEPVRLRILEERLSGLTGVRAIRFESFTEIFIDSKNRAKKKPSAFLSDRLKMANEFLGDFWLKDITTDTIRQYFDKRLESVSKSTVKKDRNALNALFNWGKRHGYSGNPVEKTDDIKEPQGRTKYLPPEKQAKLLSACDNQLKALVLLALRTGMRMNEMLSLTRADYDAARKCVTVRALNSKTDRERVIFLNSECLDILNGLAFWAKTDEAKLFSFFAQKANPRRVVNWHYSAACKLAGIKGFTFHDLRHTHGTELAEAGVKAIAIMERLGHSSLKMTERYVHPQEGWKREQAGIYEDYLKAQEKKADAKEA